MADLTAAPSTCWRAWASVHVDLVWPRTARTIAHGSSAGLPCCTASLDDLHAASGDAHLGGRAAMFNASVGSLGVQNRGKVLEHRRAVRYAVTDWVAAIIRDDQASRASASLQRNGQCSRATAAEPPDQGLRNEIAGRENQRPPTDRLQRQLFYSQLDRDVPNCRSEEFDKIVNHRFEEVGMTINTAVCKTIRHTERRRQAPHSFVFLLLSEPVVVRYLRISVEQQQQADHDVGPFYKLADPDGLQ